LSDLSFGVRPIELADALYNAVELSADHGGKPGCPHVLIAYQPDAGGVLGVVTVYGVSRLIGGRTTIILDTQAPEDYAAVAIDRDKAQELQSALRGYGRAKSTRVGVRISDDGFDVVDFDEDGDPVVVTVNLTVSKDDTEIAALADSDPGGAFSGHFDIVDDYLIGSGAPLLAPTLLTFDALRRLIGLKGLEAKAVDIAMTKREHILAIAAGPHFRGILGQLDRGVYADDGLRSSHLLD
jgi:hypothetical protein